MVYTHLFQIICFAVKIGNWAVIIDILLVSSFEDDFYDDNEMRMIHWLCINIDYKLTIEVIISEADLIMIMGRSAWSGELPLSE